MYSTSYSKASRFKNFWVWNIIFGAKTGLWFGWIGASGYGIVGAESIWAILLWQLSMGAAIAHGVELQHQALHQTGFASRRLNRIFGVLLGMPMLVSYSAYQDSHLFHHKKVGTAEDEEFFDYGASKKTTKSKLFVHFFLVNHYREALKRSYLACTAQTLPTKLLRNGAKIRAEYLMMLTALIFLAAFSIAAKECWFLTLWLVPLVFFAAPIHALIELPEHYGCERSADYTKNTRSISAGRLAAWFTNGNCFHVEHHSKAALPIERLGAMHREIRKESRYVSPSYWAFYRGFLADVRKQLRQSNGV